MYLRTATDDDLEFLYDMLVAAFNWDGTQRFTRTEIVEDPRTAHYVDGWRRGEAFGVVAIDGDEPVGALWAQALPADTPGYGYVADDVPEIGIAVAAGHRGLGVGARLLAGGIDAARERGWRALSLSVEDGNDTARALYERHGFVVVGRNGDSDTMMREF